MPIKYTGPTIYIPTKDDYAIDQYTKLLVRCDTNTRYIQDECGHVITQYGNAAIGSTINPNTMGGNVYLPDTNSYCTISDSDDWNLGIDDFTIDWWEYRLSVVHNTGLLTRLYSAAYQGFLLGYYTTGYPTLIVLFLSSNTTTWNIADAVSLGTYNLNTWNHLALVRNGSSFKTYKNGTMVSSFTSSAAIHNTVGNMGIGIYNSQTNRFTGYIDCLRLTKGKALWLTSFGVPRRRKI